MSELTKALCAFHSDVGAIHKSAKAQYGLFADLSTVLSTVIPPLVKNGLVITQTFQPSEIGAEAYLVTTLRHISGETIESVLPLVVNQGRNRLHDLGASVTYLRRYALLSLIGLVADVDTDGAFVEDEPKAKSTPPAKPAGKKTVAKKVAPKAAPAPEPTPEDKPLSQDDRAMVMQLLHEKHSQSATQIQQLSKAFAEYFPDTSDLPLSQALRTEAHAAFINQYFLDNADPR